MKRPLSQLRPFGPFVGAHAFGGNPTQVDMAVRRLDRFAEVDSTTRVAEDQYAIDFKLSLPRVREVGSSIVMASDGTLIMYEVRFPPFLDVDDQQEAQDMLEDLMADSEVPDESFSFVRELSMNPHMRLEAGRLEKTMSVDEALDQINQMQELYRQRHTR